MKLIKRYLYIWYLMTKATFLVNTKRKLGFLIFFIGKMLRFLLSFFFLFYVMRGSSHLAGYDGKQVIFFYLTFMFIDALAQVFFRNVYSFRQQVVTGGFDLTLTKPVNALFRVLLGGMDMIDIATLPFFLTVLIWWGIGLHPTVINSLLYLLMIANSIVLAMAFHIFVVATGIITFEIDHLIMIYRDVESMGRYPVDIYREPIKSVLTFFIPIGIMMTFPAKIFMGNMPYYFIVIAILVSGILLYFSLLYWRFALRRYSSASS
jgi:ABC-2 type transport system permease protein